MQRFHPPGRSLHPLPTAWIVLGWGGAWPLAGGSIASTLRGLARAACPQKDLKVFKIFKILKILKILKIFKSFCGQASWARPRRVKQCFHPPGARLHPSPRRPKQRAGGRGTCPAGEALRPPSEIVLPPP